jgi:hypothetical protein
MTSILFLNNLPVNKSNRLAPVRIKTKHKRHIELKGNATNPIPVASSNYILSIILI